MADLKTNYKDDIPAESENEKRRYNVIHNADGTITLEDATEYTQKGDDFGSADINATNTRVNEIDNSLSEIDIRYNSETGSPEWSPRGADTWSPFKSSFAEETKFATYGRLNAGGDTIYFTFSHPVLGIKKITWSDGNIGLAQFVSSYSVSGNIVILNTSKRGDYGSFPQNLTISITVVYEK